MFVFYVDESGKPDQKNLSHIIYGGLVVHDRHYGFIIKSVREIFRKIFSHDMQEGIEIHAVEIYNGRKEWKNYDLEQRINFLIEVCKFINTIYHSTIFAIAAKKDSAFFLEKGSHGVFEEVIGRFGRFLGSFKNIKEYEGIKSYSGLVIMDEESRNNDKNLRNISNGVRRNNSNSQIFHSSHFIQEDSLFVDSKNSICMQLSDVICFSIHRYYNQNDHRFMPLFQDKFFRDNIGVIHGLTHKRNTHDKCECIACHRKATNPA
jgi:hypothetical protein